MTRRRRSRLLAVAAAALGALLPAAASAQSVLDTTSAFVGYWCLDDDPNRHALITGDALVLTVRLEGGGTFRGTIAAMSSHDIRSLQTRTRGRLSADEEHIAWSDGASWTRCLDVVDIAGTWFAAGDPARPNIVGQAQFTLTLRDENGVAGSGAFSSRRTVTANWAGIRIVGTISPDQRRIDWSNGTFWTR